MEPSDLLHHRTALIGAAVALTIGLVGGLSLKVGNQDGPHMDTAYAGEIISPDVQPIAWPSGKAPDYVLGTDFLRAQQPQPPVVVASYDVPEYVPTMSDEPPPTRQPQAQPISLAWSSERAWPSTGGDILDTRLPDDPPSAPEPPPEIDAPEAPQALSPVTMAAVD